MTPICKELQSNVRRYVSVFRTWSSIIKLCYKFQAHISDEARELDIWGEAYAPCSKLFIRLLSCQIHSINFWALFSANYFNFCWLKIVCKWKKNEINWKNALKVFFPLLQRTNEAVNIFLMLAQAFNIPTTSACYEINSRWNFFSGNVFSWGFGT